MTPSILDHDPESGCDECRFHCVALEECWADPLRTVETNPGPPAPSDCPMRSRPIVVCSTRPMLAESLARALIEALDDETDVAVEMGARSETLRPLLGMRFELEAWLDDGERPIAPGPEKSHPRQGFVAEIWLARLPGALVLLEIFETYNAWGQPSSLGYHYRPYDLTGGRAMETKTIGAMPLVQMRAFAMGQVSDYASWSQLR